MKANFSLSDAQWKQLFVALVTFLLAVASVFGYDYAVVQPREVAQQSALLQSIGDQLDARLGNAPAGIGARAQAVLYPAAFTDLTVNKTLTGKGAVSLASTLAVTGAQTNSSSLSVGAFLVLAPSTAITVTNGNPFTPTASEQKIQAAGTVTPTLAITNAAGSAYANGTVLRLLNVSNQTINLADSGNVKLAGAWVGGQYDTLTLVFDTTTSTWIEASRSDN